NKIRKIKTWHAFRYNRSQEKDMLFHKETSISGSHKDERYSTYGIGQHMDGLRKKRSGGRGYQEKPGYRLG
ncbi:MAG TPA: hypothetical protein P5146_12280, partial [Desulfomonilia bacterium]|nr:hypothetical protein [Desulfomonilia bacterium]